MKSAALAFALGVVSVISAAAGAGAEQVQEVDAQTLAAVARCAKERDSAARHVCLDRVLRDGGLLASSPAAATPAPPPAPAAGTSLRLPAPRVADSAAKPDRAAVRLIGTIRTGDGTRVLAMQDGSVWREARAADLSGKGELLKGQIVIISRSASGGFTCEPASASAFSCYQMH